MRLDKSEVDQRDKPEDKYYAGVVKNVIGDQQEEERADRPDRAAKQ